MKLSKLSPLSKLFAVVFLGSIGMSQAHAACVKLNNWKTVNVNMTGGAIVVQATDPIGKLLRTFTTTIPADQSGVQPTNGFYQATSTCQGGGQAFGIVLKGQPATGAGVPDNVFTTNIPGIGVRLVRSVATANGSFTQAYTRAGGTPINIPSGSFGGVYGGTEFRTEIYKISDQTGSGSLDAGQYSTAYFDGSGQGAPYITSTLAANIITILTPTCSVDPGSAYQKVLLDKVPAGTFKGRGSTAAETPFNIKLNCVKGVGIVKMIELAFIGTNDGNTRPAEGVLKQTLTTSTAAKNVGIQVINNHNSANTPIPLGGTIDVGLSKDGQYVLPFIARYFQTTATKVTPGPVAATMTFMIQYR